jgi:hypothetical protein
MPIFRAFIDDYNVEREILHDKKWPRLLVKPTGEILSVAMAKRIMRLLTQGMSYEEIPVKFREEWNREIDSDTVEAVLEMNFDTTDHPVPEGEHLICPDDPAIDHPEFVRGTIIPSGIYYEIVNLRDYEPNFVEGYVAVRWGLEVNEDMIVEIWDDWQDALPRNEVGLPLIPDGDVRPVPPGRRLYDLGNGTSEAQDRRSSFSIPPPLYSPRPTWGNMTFRHPREVTGYGDHLPPFYTGTTVPHPPDFTSGDSPPAYGNSPEAMGERSYRSTPGPNLPSAQDSPASPPSLSLYQPVPSERKHPGWPNCPEILSKVFTKQDIIEYLYDGIDHGTIVYAGGPHEPTRIEFEEPPENPSRIRRILILAAAQRVREGVQSTLTWRFVENQTPTPWEIIDGSMDFTVKGLFALLLKNVDERVPYLEDLPPSVNARGLVNHLRIIRGFQVVDLGGDSSSLTAALLEMLQWITDPAVILTFRTYPRDFAWTFVSFSDFLRQVELRRRLLERPALFPSNQTDSLMTDALINPYNATPMTDRVTNQPGTQLNGHVANQATPSPLRNVTLMTPAQSPEANSGTPNTDTDTPDEDAEAYSASRPMSTAETELLGDLHAARIARHTRILHRLQDWLTFLTDLPENTDEGLPIARHLQRFQAEIDRYRESPDHQPRLWVIGYDCEEFLGDLEIETFVKIHEVSQDGTLHWDRRFDDWQTRWFRDLEAEREEFFTKFYCLTHGILRVRQLPAGALGSLFFRHDRVVRDLEKIVESLNMVTEIDSWAGTRENLQAIAAGPAGRIPEAIVEMRFKIRAALLTLDSFNIITDSRMGDNATNHGEASEQSLSRPGNAQHGTNGEDGDVHMDDEYYFEDHERSSLFMSTWEGIPPTPVDDTDRPPIRAQDMGPVRRTMYRNAMAGRLRTQQINIHVSPRHSVDMDVDGDRDMSEDDGNSSGAAQRGDSEEFEPGPTGPGHRSPREPIEPTSDGAMQAHHPNIESEEQLHILPPPPRPPLPDLQTFDVDTDGDQEMQLDTPRSADRERSLQWE